MVIVTVVSAFSLLLTYFLTKSCGEDISQLSEPHSELVYTGIQIICGDCSGENDIPIKTYIDRLGNCSQCGGRSYILASGRFIYAQQLVATRRQQYKAARDKCGIVPQKEGRLRWSLGGLTTRTY